MEEKINYWYIIGYVVTVNIGFFNCGYFDCHYNSLTEFMYRRYGFENKDYFNTIVASLIPFGAMFGGLVGGVLAQYGRRLAGLISALAMAIGSLWTTYMSVTSLIIGRFIIGMSMGVTVAVAPMLVIEISPRSISGPLGIVNQLMGVTGLLLGQVTGLFVPYASSPDTETTQVWKMVYVLPCFTSSLEAILLLAVFRNDTPKFYQLSQQSDPNLNESKSSNFNTNDSIIPKQNEEKSDGEIETESTWSEIFDSQHRPALFVGGMLAFFHQATGISSVTFFSNEIFTKGHSGDEAEFRARIGTIGTGIISFFASLFALIASKRFGRKTILFYGEIAMLILLFCMFSFTLRCRQMATTFVAILFVFTFNGSFGAVLWLYCSEILTTKGGAFAGFINLIFTIVFGSGAPLLFANMTVPGVYLMLFSIQFITLWFIHFRIIETDGLTQQELKTLYIQKKDKEL